uniref:Putative ovule protein n=1 Tax=Solanum chacoense TaxID=4108 RepID=A0A0V0GW40_SOLCH
MVHFELFPYALLYFLLCIFNCCIRAVGLSKIASLPLRGSVRSAYIISSPYPTFGISLGMLLLISLHRMYIYSFGVVYLMKEEKTTTIFFRV